jgi:hypothetical protein
MLETDHPEDFKAKWNGHIDQLSALWNTLPDEELDRLRETQEELRDLVDIAAEELEGDDGE